MAADGMLVLGRDSEASIARALLVRRRRCARRCVPAEGCRARAESPEAGGTSARGCIHQRDAHLPRRQRSRRHQVGRRVRAEPGQGPAVRLRGLRADRRRDRPAARADRRWVGSPSAHRRCLRRRDASRAGPAGAARDRRGRRAGSAAPRAAARAAPRHRAGEGLRRGARCVAGAARPRGRPGRGGGLRRA